MDINKWENYSLNSRKCSLITRGVMAGATVFLLMWGGNDSFLLKYYWTLDILQYFIGGEIFHYRATFNKKEPIMWYKNPVHITSITYCGKVILALMVIWSIL